MFKMSKRLKLDIINSRNIIRQKLKALRRGHAEEEVQLEKSYKPVTQTLKQIATSLQNVKKEKEDVKLEPKEEKRESFINASESSLPQPKFLETEVLAQHEPESDYDSSDSENLSFADKTIQEMVEHPSFQSYLDQFHPLPRQYVEEMITNSEEFDHKSGIRHDPETEKFKMGNEEVTIDGKDILIGNIRYEGTPGLYELVFKKHPRGFNKKDEMDYRDMLKRTSAHRRHYLPAEQIQGNRSWKYKHIIGKAFEKPRHHSWAGETSGETRSMKGGKGLFMNLNNKKVDYVYWDNPNELVDRLRLLLASKNVGNTNHDNEIISIIEELYEANILAKR